MQVSGKSLAALLLSIKGLKKVADDTFETTWKALKKGLVCCSMQWHGPKYVTSVEKMVIPGYEQFATMFNWCDINMKMWTCY